METPSPASLTTAQIILSLIAASIAGGVVSLLITKITNWTSGRTKAEVVEIHARSVKLGTEAEMLSAQQVREATNRIVELVEINSQLQEELSECSRQRDDFEFDLRRERFEHQQLETRHQIQSHFVMQLEAANKLGVRLSDLPSELKVVEPGKPLLRASGTAGATDIKDDQMG